MKQGIVWKLKKHIGFIGAVCIGILLFEYSYAQLGYIQYTGAENAVFMLQLLMGCSSVGWSGILFPILAVLPMAVNYVREYKTGYINIRFTKERKQDYLIKTLVKNGIAGGIALMIPLCLIVIHLCLDKGLDAPMITEEGLTVVKFMTEFGEHHPAGYMLYQIIQVFFCGAAFATLGLGISAWVKNEFLTLLLPFALCILVAILTPNHTWDLLLLYCINAYVDVPIWHIVVMDSVLILAGIGLFVFGVYRNETKDDKKKS